MGSCLPEVLWHSSRTGGRVVQVNHSSMLSQAPSGTVGPCHPPRGRGSADGAHREVPAVASTEGTIGELASGHKV